MGESNLKKLSPPTTLKRRDVRQTPAQPDAAARKAKTGVFRFFDLPRELRDQIYYDSLIFKRKFESQHGSRLRARRMADVNLLVISHRFREEYLERAERHTCVVVTDRGIYHGEFLKLPNPLKYATRLEIFVAACCESPALHGNSRHPCSVVREIRMHRKWIENLCSQMRNLSSLKIEIMLDPHKRVSGCEDALLREQHRLTGLDERVAPLRSLEVYHSSHYVSEGVWSFNRPRTLVMRYVPETGELRRIEEGVERRPSGAGEKVEEKVVSGGGDDQGES
ncbi:hypothetical protein EJ03DRAFT_16056 [Teratosphaeria nubilosa]|uniref:Uncharacterized protein n=1 Tax=Teratosphaeria nubilosa TaxID=161662 RepID=A0A6G1KVY6_9PEZI|nr:hypothetical protein EJ03DRAFT_16056 [Teratosphaeria nubilosa]